MGEYEHRGVVRPGTLRLAAALVALTVCAGALAASAPAQDPGQIPSDPTSAIPDPGATGEQLAAEQGLDSRYTPVPKPGCQIGWTQWAGALYPGLSQEEECGYKDMAQLDEDPELDWASPTPPTVDFYTVSFLNPDRGLAGGAQCEDDPAPRGPEEERSAYEQRLTEFLKDCTRVPVIYRYVGDDPRLGAHWTQAYKGSSPGYVGAISWLQNTDVKKNGQRALAVGGDGVYVRRESGDIKDSDCVESSNASEQALSDCEDRWRRDHDPAGMGRAWLMLGSGTWRDLNAEGDVPSRMRGMNALDSSSRPDDCAIGSEIPRRECAMAGGLQQIWMWSEGQFDQTPWEPDVADTNPETNRSRTTTTCGETTWVCEWHFRIRAIRFSPTVSGSAARAVTAGCCSATGQPDQSRGGASTLRYSRSGFANGWGAGGGHAEDATLGTGPSRQYRLPNRVADSLYAFNFGGTAASPAISYLSTPGGPRRPGEPPSQIVDASIVRFAPTEVGRYHLTSARLVSGDGDLQGHQPFFSVKASGGSESSGPDGLVDWAVGGFKTTDRGVAFTTTTAGVPVHQDIPDPPYPFTCPIGAMGTTPERIPSECEVDQKNVAPKGGGDLFSLSSYFLNAYTMVGNTGIGWGVGDRGAIMRLAGEAASGGAGGTLSPESPPRLGPKQLSPAPAREPYGSGPALDGEPGPVPSLASAEQVRLPGPQVSSYGTPNPPGGDNVADIAASRDGREAWAIGPSSYHIGRPTTLHHFDGVRWTRCSPDALEGVLEADPACEALWPLFHYKNGVALTAIARVPLEHDSDPSNDNEFEAVAAGAYPSGGPPPVILRYREGRWSVDERATKEITVFNPEAGTSPGGQPITEIAFSAPNDGWMISQNISGGGLTVFHFDGASWTQCTGWFNQLSFGEDKAICQDLGAEGGIGFIPVAENGQSPLRLTSAGRRLYLYGNRGATGGDQFPLILFKDPGPCTETDTSGCWQQAYDRGCANHKQGGSCVASADPREQGTLRSLSVALHEDGSYNGWGAGFFGTGRLGNQSGTRPRVTRRPHETPLIRSELNGTSWAPTDVRGTAADDYLLEREIPKSSKSFSVFGGELGSNRVVALPGPDGAGRVFVAPNTGGANGANGPIIWRDPERDRWKVLPTPFAAVQEFSTEAGAIQQIAPDNAGGLWIVGNPILHAAGNFFYRFSDLAPKDVFEEASHPIREQITAAAGGPDGSFWVATDSGAVYRYDRISGWDQMEVKGWDPGRIVTNPSGATAIAVGPGGEGLVVGEQGRMAEVGPRGAVLDAASGLLCGEGQGGPCGSGRHLRAVAIAPDDGSALVGGDARALLYRAGADGAFHAVTPPPTVISATITAISMPKAGEAYLVTNTGQIYSGALEGADWSWTREDRDEFGGSISRDVRNSQIHRPLRAIAIDGSGHGYAVGDHGTILERTGVGSQPWRRVDAGYLDDLTAVTLAPDGRGVLIGGEDGLVLTGTAGVFEPARHADRYAPIVHPGSSVVGTALLPGYRDGQIEAWVASRIGRAGGLGALLHYASDPSEPLLDGGSRRAEPLPDSPPASAEELGFAAFGNSGCQYPNGGSGFVCTELIGSEHANDVTARAVRDAILDGGPGAPRFALLTGDVGDYGGRARNNDEDLTTPLETSLIHRRWAELIAQPLLDSGLPVYGAVGRRDLSTADSCYVFPVLGSCAAAWAGFAVSGSTFRSTSSAGWRQGMAGMPAPWGEPGAPAAPSRDGLSFVEVGSSGPKQEPGDKTVEDPTEGEGTPDRTVEDPTEGLPEQTVPTDPANQGATPDQTTLPPHPGDQTVRGGQVGDQTIPTGGAHTHYAFDVKEDGEALMRVVVLDSSVDSLAASDPNQNPTEEQLAWLREVLSTWPAEKRAVVVTNTPTYSYGPGALSDTAPDGTALEAILMAADVDLVVSGRLAWNGLYWALAPGVHCPGPGGGYPKNPNRGPALSDCSGQGQDQADQAVSDAQKATGDAIGGTAGADPLPVAIASSAGVGPFGPRGADTGPATNGFWHGYTEVRIDPISDVPPIIEQRPVFDWIGIGAGRGASHVLRPNQKLALKGYGREAAGIDVPFRYDEISTPAITHRFDLVYADPDKPWLPKRDEGSADDSSEYRSPASERSGEEDPCGPYLCLRANVGTIDEQSGDVRAGSGAYPRTFAIAQLSVNQRSAVYPLVFEPRASYRAPTPTLPRPSLPPPPSPPSQPPQPGTPNVEPPPPPAIPPTESPLALTPVIPPTPPSYGNASPIDLGIAPVAIVAPPPTVVLQPPNPVVQPAPPSGARREARQRQAATQKSGADAASEQSDIQESGGDLAGGPPEPKGSAATRYEFTTLGGREQPSAWARDALIGGGLGIAALVLALGLSGARPTPRRRQPEVPAPALAREHLKRR